MSSLPTDQSTPTGNPTDDDQEGIQVGMLTMMAWAMSAATIIATFIPVLASAIIDDFGLSRSQIGSITGSASLVAALAAPVVGHLVDRIGARRGIILVFISGAAGHAVVAVSVGYVTLLLASVITAIATAMSNPSTNKMIATEVASKRRGLVTGIKQSGVQLGAFIGGATFVTLEQQVGWRGVAALVSGLFAIGAIASSVILPHSEDSPPNTTPTGHPTSSAKLPRATKWLTAYGFLMGLGGSPLFSFLALYAEEALDASRQSAGWMVALAGLTGFVGRIGWSVFTDRHGDFPSSLLALSSIAMLGGITALLAQSTGVWLLWVTAVLAGLSISAWNSVAMLAIIREAGPQLAGRMSGIVVGGFMLGLAIGPPIFGASVDRLDSYSPGFVVVTGLFVAASTVMATWRHKSRQTT